MDFSAIHRIPVEIWDIILFQNLNPGKDLYSLYNASFIWRHILEDTKPEWLFVQIFPLIVKQLSRRDVLQCREVCKRWSYGIDHFLENNVIQRPCSEYAVTTECESLQDWFIDAKLDFNFGNLMQQKRLITQAVQHPRNPIVGRSISIQYPQLLHIEHGPREDNSQIGIQILETFGSHIHFLRIRFFQNPPQNLLIYFVQLFELADLSNLKKLEINYWYMETEQDESIVEDQLQQYFDNLSEEQKNRFPKHLETLIITGIYGFCSLKLHEIFVSLFSKTLKSFTKWNTKPFVFPKTIQFTNLSHLVLCVGSPDTLKSLLKLKSPLKRLSLHFKIKNLESTKLFFQVINNFSGTLKGLELQLPQQDPSCIETITPFVIPCFLKLPHILDLTFSNYLPPSFNFISGLKSLQYLSFNVHPRYINKEQLQFVNTIYPEKIDIASRLLSVYLESGLQQQQIMYSSNLWKIFKRLRTLTLNGLKSGKKLELRRDIYEIVNLNQAKKFFE